jgi:hypothetical protein
MSVVFISYRREDSAGFAGRLHESLARRLGEDEVFRDVDALEPGQDFVDAIHARLRHCSACVALIGREWLDARDESGRRRLEQEHDYVRLEIAAALARPDALVVPALVEGVSMPVADALPESIRALSRRQAVSLRDETWDADVDRLVAALRKTPLPARASRRPVWTWVAAAVAVVVASLLILRFQPARNDVAAPPAGDTAAVTADRSNESVAAPAYSIAIPRLSEVEDGEVVYTLLSGAATAGNPSIVRLRFRFSNEGRNPANFWDNAFRLAIGGKVLAPVSGLNEVVEGHSLQQGIVRFDLPAKTTDAVLRVIGQDGVAELPLDLRSIGTPSDVDKPDTTDALSRAVFVRVTREPRPLVTGKPVDYTLVSATMRRFVNTLRVVATVRVANHGRYPFLFGTDVIRLVVDGQATAPTRGPSEAVSSDTTASADFVFDLPPSVGKVSLVVQGESTADVPLELPASVR